MSGYLARMRGYLAEMFPLPRHLLGALLSYLAVASFVRVLHGSTLPLLGWSGLAGVWSFFAIVLVLRLMDELKDAGIDAALFPGRPLPSGRVRESDIRRTLAGVALLYLAANAWSMPTALMAGAVLGYAWLMYWRFFAPALLQRSLPLTLVTHNPIVPLILAYGTVLFAAEQSLSPAALQWSRLAPYLVMLWAPFLGWEFARKIRAAGDEDAYVTYSQLCGPRVAVALALATQGLALLLTLLLWRWLGLSWFYPLLPALAYLACVFAGVRFLLAPSTASARLKPFAEAYIVAMLAAQVIEFTRQLPWLG